MNQSIVNQIILSYAGGILAFLSPCLVPSLFGYLAFLTGSAVLGGPSDRARIIRTSLIFGAGFCLLFAIGIIQSSTQVFLMDAYQISAKITGVVAIAAGLLLVNRSNAARGRDNADSDDLGGAPFGLPGAFVIGALFGAVWPHCLGPILDAILNIATVPWTAARGNFLIVLYVLGLVTAFGLSGAALSALSARFLDRISRDQRLIVLKGSGVVLAAIGVTQVYTLLWLKISQVFIVFANNSVVSDLEELLMRLLG